MKKKHIWVGTLLGTVVVTAAITLHASKKVIRKNCKRQVKKKLGEVPFVSDEFAAEQADAICKV